jgi:hypothetical protein
MSKFTVATITNPSRLDESTAGAPAPDDYDPAADMKASIAECYRAVKERVAAGGPGWEGWPK